MPYGRTASISLMSSSSTTTNSESSSPRTPDYQSLPAAPPIPSQTLRKKASWVEDYNSDDELESGVAGQMDSGKEDTREWLFWMDERAAKAEVAQGDSKEYDSADDEDDHPSKLAHSSTTPANVITPPPRESFFGPRSRWVQRCPSRLEFSPPNTASPNPNKPISLADMLGLMHVAFKLCLAVIWAIVGGIGSGQKPREQACRSEDKKVWR